MKLSAFLALSVPLAAMAQMPALADGACMSDTSNWLKASIATLKAAPKAPSSKVSHAMPAQMPTAGKLRPFVPNRYLPHERDLACPLMSQQGQVDPSIYANAASGRLSGEVATSYGAPYMVPGSDRNSAMLAGAAEPRVMTIARPRSRVPRVMPGQAPLLPDQLTCKSTITSVIPDPPPANRYAGKRRPEFPITVPLSALPPPSTNTNFSMPPAACSTAFDPPSISAQEQMLLERLMAQNKPTAIMGTNGEIYGQTVDNPENGTGPTPFPSSLISGNAVKGFGTMSMRRPAHVPRARFGSWHQESAALPECGFHSYVPCRQPHLYALNVAPARPREHERKPSARRLGKPAVRLAENRPAATLHSYASEAPKVALATYPTYVSRSGLSY